MANKVVLEKISKLKTRDVSEAKAMSLPVLIREGMTVSLVPIGPWILTEEHIINLMATWRKGAMRMFLAQFDSTYERTRSYLENLAISEQDRLLFLVLQGDEAIGHIGFSNIQDEKAELDNVMKGSPLVFPDLMFEISTALIDWGFQALDLRNIHLQVTSHNESALKLYSRLGFKTENRLPLRLEHGEGLTLHVPCALEESDVPFQLVIMRLDRDGWLVSGIKDLV